MRSNLGGVRQKVERLADEARGQSCDGRHVRVKWSERWPGDARPLEPWPAPGDPLVCACGREFDYRHIVSGESA